MGLTYTKEDEKLFEVLSKLKTKEDVKNFLEDLCTIKEVKDMSKRLEAANLLSEGRKYQDVTKTTG
ncbi:MAG: YerC/YecD family TrpR-related protein, partial [Lachnospiraceae bacterium]|nr:YerC/YecD family TrpR-related protein [Lachnospiraceae bacterium]